MTIENSTINSECEINIDDILNDGLDASNNILSVKDINRSMVVIPSFIALIIFLFFLISWPFTDNSSINNTSHPYSQTVDQLINYS